MGEEGREGDWECSGCNNRNYAFRSLCNRCKQSRLFVDANTPPDSKWLPRIGDWICSGCTNNNYASREKCKKCGQPKEVAAMPAIAIHGASLPTYSHYFARTQGGPEQKMSTRFVGNGALQQPLPLGPNWSVAGDKYGVHSASTWPLGGNYGAGLPSPNPANQDLSVPKGWRNGDWICSCGFHNYSSRAQCKKCHASTPPALGTKRLASEEFVNDWDNKRLNAGHLHNHFMNVLPIGHRQAYPGYEQLVAPVIDPKVGLYAPYPNVNSGLPPNLPVPMQFSHHVTPPALLRKGAKQWRDGDWMCANCNNHNYASRSECNRCKTERDVLAQTNSAV